MKKQDLIRRIIENGQGNLSQEDFRALEAWKAESSDNRVFAESIEQTFQLSGGYGEDVDFDASKAFNKFQKRINIEEATPTTNSNIHRLRFLKIAASIAIIISLATAFWFQQSNGTGALAKVYSENGETLTLIDKTKVVLNKKGSLTHFTTISDTKRAATLDGEAFFDVHRMIEKPFVITTNSMKIEVLGTSFNVRDFDAEDESLVFVKSGKVKVSSLTIPDSKTVLTAGQQLVIDKTTGKIKKDREENLNALSWMEDKLSFRKTKLKYAIKDLERYFNISIELKNKSIEDCPYTSLFNAPKKNEMIETIAATFNLQLKQIGEMNYELSGGSCE